MAVSNPTVRLRQLYILLAILNLVTIGAGVFLTHVSEQHFSTSVESSERWVRRAAEYSQFLTLARAANAPGNDVFLTRDVAAERAHAAAATAEFDRTLADARTNLRRDPALDSRVLARNLDAIEADFSRMRVTEEGIFAHFTNGRFDSASARMAEMDRAYADVLFDVNTILKNVRRTELNLLIREQAEAHRLQLFEIAFGFFAVVAVLLTASHLHRLSLHVVSSAERDRLLEELRVSEQRLSFVSRATVDVIWDRDLAHNQVWVNEALTMHTGWERSEAGTVPFELWTRAVHPDDQPRVVEELNQAVKERRPWSVEYRFRTKDGSCVAVLDRGDAVRDADGKVRRMIGTVMNMSEMKQRENDLREAHAELTAVNRRKRLILSAAADGIVGLDENGVATFMNPAAEKLTGWDLGTLNLRLGAMPLAPFDRATVRGPHEGEGSMERADGTTFAAEFSVSPQLDEAGQLVGTVVCFRDITQRHEVAKMKDEFVSVVSHELRTPLTSIRASLGLLASGVLGEVSARGQRMLEIATSNTDRLVRLINDILDIEKMESGRATLSKRRCAVTELMQQSVDVVRNLAEKADVRIVVEPLTAEITVDPDRIVQTMTNLLSNAIKFSNAGSTVHFSALLENGDVAFTVRDSGRGIPAEKLDVIFEKFQQVDASDSREKGGTGLGLPITKSIVAQHGGTMRVKSAIGEGSEFIFTIPAQSVDGVLQSRVVIFEADRTNRLLLESKLRNRNFVPVGVANAEELHDEVARQTPDAIVVDLNPSGGCAWATLRELKTKSATAEIPVVIISADAPADAQSIEGWVRSARDDKQLVAALRAAMNRSGQPVVMIVEDDNDLARVLMASFERHAIRAVHARDGREAAMLAESLVPDLMVLDVALPEMDGYSLVELLRDDADFASVPVVVYSAAEMTDDDKARLELGPTEFLTKSRVSPDVFEQHVVRLLQMLVAEKKEKQRHAA